MMRRAIQGATTSRHTAPLKVACLSFSSNYTGKSERRSGKSYTEKKANPVVYDDDEYTPPPQRNIKNHYAGLFKPRPKKISFTSKFDSVDMEAREPELVPKAAAPKQQQQQQHHHQQAKTSHNKNHSSYPKKWTHEKKPQKAAVVVEEEVEEPVEAVREEEVEVETPKRFVANQKVAPVHKSVDVVEEEDDGDDVLRALEIPDDDEKAVVETKRSSEVAAMEEEEDEATEGGDESMQVVREHPFFKDLVARLNKDMIRFRKDIRASGRYNAEVINTCVRPLLQLTDYPFTAVQIAHVASAINPAVLKSSLGDLHACRRLNLYRSRDTELLLDWSVEDFLRRRYESIHLSWEPMSVVYRRFGWNPEVISDRDCLLFFSNFTDFVDLAELSEDVDGKPEELPITDAVARAEEGSLPASRLLIRRKASEDAEPSLTESIRLMGVPALERPHKGKRSHKRDGTVSDMYAAMDDAAAEVDGDDQDKLDHATMSVPSMRQATHPRGRVIREFSVPSEQHQRKAGGNNKSRKTKAVEQDDDDSLAGAEDMDSLVSAYHKAKVEVSLIRRRLLRTDDVDQVSDLQRSLTRSRAILSKLSERLNEANRGSGVPKVLRGEGEEEAATATAAVDNADEVENVNADNDNNDNNDDDGDNEMIASDDSPKEERSVGFVVPTNAPKYRVAPEFTVEDLERNEESAEAVDIDEDEIENAIHTYNAEQESNRVRMTPTAEEDANADVEEVERFTAEKDDLAAEDEAEVDADDEPLTVAEPMSRLEELALKREKIEGEVQAAEEELQGLLKRKQDMEKEMQQSIDDAERTVESLKSELHFIEEEENTVKAQEMEAKLQAQREEQLQNLEKQRHEAQKAMKAAEEAAQRQKEAEQAALELEKELLRKLEQVRSRLNGTSAEEERVSHHDEHAAAVAEAEDDEELVGAASAHHEEEAQQEHHQTTSAAAAEEEEEMAATTADHEAPAATTTTTTTNGFMCSPEQYDGLHLAAARLRREISALETQMEVEGDEDDETLMAVLAESRADLEELNDCIASVQQNATWAKARDVARAKDEAKQASTQDTEYQKIQKELETVRFNISLLEKRLMHTTSRSVQSKLEQGIVSARRQISSLRIAQDRLRRQGATTFGLPSSISMAETLAYEVKKSDAERMAEEVRRAAQNDYTTNEEEEVDAENATADAAAEAEEEEAPYTAQAKEEEEELSAHDDAVATAEEENANPSSSPSDELKAAAESADTQEPFEDAEAEKLRLRLDGMLESIQSLQGTIEVQERANDYDDEETEAVLKAMRDKLTMLMKLRDDIRQRLMQSSKAKAAQNPPTADVLAAPSRTPSPNRVVATTNYPLSPATARKTNKKVFRASKKIRRTAKNGRK